MASKKPLPIGIRPIAALIGVGLAAAITFYFLWRDGLSQNTLEFEAAKTCLQVLGLVVLGGVVASATSSVERSRQDEAELRQYHDEEFKVRAQLLERATRCADKMYMSCRFVERLQDSGGTDNGSGDDGHGRGVCVPEFLHDAFLEFSAEGLTVRGEIGARFATAPSPGPAKRAEPRTGTKDITIGESTLLWHQVYDLLTVYYYSLTGTFPRDLLKGTSKNDTAFHSGVDFFEVIPEGDRPTLEQRGEVHRRVREAYSLGAMPRLAKALLEDELVVPSRPSSATTRGPRREH